MVSDVEYFAVDAERRWNRSILNHVIGFLDADGQPKSPGAVGQLIDQLLEVPLGVTDQGCVIIKEHFSDEDYVNLGLGYQAGYVEQSCVTSGV